MLENSEKYIYSLPSGYKYKIFRGLKPSLLCSISFSTNRVLPDLSMDFNIWLSIEKSYEMVLETLTQMILI